MSHFVGQPILAAAAFQAALPQTHSWFYTRFSCLPATLFSSPLCASSAFSASLRGRELSAATPKTIVSPAVSAFSLSRLLRVRLRVSASPR